MKIGCIRFLIDFPLKGVDSAFDLTSVFNLMLDNAPERSQAEILKTSLFYFVVEIVQFNKVHFWRMCISKIGFWSCVGFVVAACNINKYWNNYE